MMIKLFFLVSILLVAEAKTPVSERDTAQNDYSYYELVTELIKVGNWNTALRVAIQGVVEPDTETVDPRLGIIAIEIATKNEAEDFYLIASQAFLISLRAVNFNDHSELIEKQIRLIFPLLTHDERSDYEEKLNNRDPSIIADYIGFWEKENPFPSTGLNERLIEHWLRIQHAKENFNRSSNTVYGTDDRGIIFVRFGPPNRIMQETIIFSSVSDPVSGIVTRFDQPTSVRIEIWSYDNFSDQEQIYIFGNRHQSGSFGLRKSVFELLPAHVMFALQEPPSLLTGGVRMRSSLKFKRQLGLIESLAKYHPYFSSLYDDYSSEIIRANSNVEGSSLGFAATQFGDTFIQREESKAVRRDLITPPSSSNFLHANNTIRSDVRKYNFFDDSGNTEIFLFAQNKHQFIDIDHNEAELRGVLSIYEYDVDWNLINVSEREIDIQRDISTFSLEISPEDHVTLAYSLEAFMKAENMDKYRLIASSGLKEINNRVSADYSNDHFRVSDLIFGRVNPEGDGRTIITPAYDQTFSGDEEVGVYFEVFSNFDEYFVSYRFERKNFMGLWREVETSFSVTLEYQKKDMRAQNWFEFNLLELRSGNYRLLMEFASDELEPIIIKEDIRIE